MIACIFLLLSINAFSSTIYFSNPLGVDTLYTKDTAIQDFNHILTSANFEIDKPENLYVDKNNNLSFKMHQGKVWIEGSGAQIILPIIARKQVDLQYKVFFYGHDNTDYEWTSGGKIMGVAGGRGYTGGDNASLGDGFSVRLMFGDGGQVFAYVYHADMPGRYGDPLNIVAYKILRQHSWNKFRISIILNTHKNYNGHLTIWVNDEFIGSRSNIRFCTNNCSIDKLLIVAFHGGNTPDYRPNKDQEIKVSWLKLSDITSY